ncbi:hypothetical protein R3P38DRAFT_3175497 [Favolaschia claudopus]|uniref:Uncharacterized protein n=1 Tax=Favolaschia claudopus TaxID=2862362 RepID=A0AAW0D101_9AGAR
MYKEKAHYNYAGRRLSRASTHLGNSLVSFLGASGNATFGSIERIEVVDSEIDKVQLIIRPQEPLPSGVEDVSQLFPQLAVCMYSSKMADFTLIVDPSQIIGYYSRFILSGDRVAIMDLSRALQLLVFFYLRRTAPPGCGHSLNHLWIRSQRESIYYISTTARTSNSPLADDFFDTAARRVYIYIPYNSQNQQHPLADDSFDPPPRRRGWLSVATTYHRVRLHLVPFLGVRVPHELNRPSYPPKQVILATAMAHHPSELRQGNHISLHQNQNTKNIFAIESTLDGHTHNSISLYTFDLKPGHIKPSNLSTFDIISERMRPLVGGGQGRTPRPPLYCLVCLHRNQLPFSTLPSSPSPPLTPSIAPHRPARHFVYHAAEASDDAPLTNFAAFGILVGFSPPRTSSSTPRHVVIPYRRLPFTSLWAHPTPALHITPPPSRLQALSYQSQNHTYLDFPLFSLLLLTTHITGSSKARILQDTAEICGLGSEGFDTATSPTFKDFIGFNISDGDAEFLSDPVGAVVPVFEQGIPGAHLSGRTTDGLTFEVGVQGITALDVQADAVVTFDYKVNNAMHSSVRHSLFYFSIILDLTAASPAPEQGCFDSARPPHPYPSPSPLNPTRLSLGAIHLHIYHRRTK